VLTKIKIKSKQIEKYDASQIKHISEYCYSSKTGDKNCGNALESLKKKLVNCEKKPVSEKNCQKFKEKFCTALPHFPCCVYVILF